MTRKISREVFQIHLGAEEANEILAAFEMFEVHKILPSIAYLTPPNIPTIDIMG